MTIEAIIWLVLVIIIALVIFKITKSIFKAIFLAISAGVLIIIIIGAMVISDSMDFKDNFPTQPSLYLFEGKDNVISGFSGVLGDDFKPSFVSEEKLASYSTNYKQDNLKAMLGNNYKVFIIKKQALASVDRVEGDDTELTRADLDKLLASETPIDDYIEMQIGIVPASQKAQAREQLLNQIGIESDVEFKGAIFGTLFTTAGEERGPLFIFEEYKEGNIIVYPETALFKFMKRMPISFVKNVIQKKEGE